MAAIWNTAASLSNFDVQEFQPQMLELCNPWLREPLQVDEGQLVVPSGPGLGIPIDEDRLQVDVEAATTLTLDD